MGGSWLDAVRNKINDVEQTLRNSQNEEKVKRARKARKEDGWYGGEKTKTYWRIVLSIEEN